MYVCCTLAYTFLNAFSDGETFIIITVQNYICLLDGRIIRRNRFTLSAITFGELSSNARGIPTGQFYLLDKVKHALRPCLKRMHVSAILKFIAE